MKPFFSSDNLILGLLTILLSVTIWLLLTIVGNGIRSLIKCEDFQDNFKWKLPWDYYIASMVSIAVILGSLSSIGYLVSLLF